MKTKSLLVATIAVLLLLAALAFGLHSKSGEDSTPPLTVAISPYQDMAQLMVYKDLGLEEKYGTKLKLVTLPWEEIQTTLASAGRTVDVGFGGLIEFLTKYENVNGGNDDPLVYVYPAYVFKGGAFVTFNPNVPDLSVASGLTNDRIKEFFSFKVGAQKNSVYDMILFSLMRRAGIDRKDVHLLDTTLADGFLAAQAGALDVASAGLTQWNETLEKGGRTVLSMDDLGFADITGFICRQSTLETRRKDIENLIRIWFDSVDYVQSDLDHHAEKPLAYLAQTASTKYTVETYKRALQAEYFPRSLDEAQRSIILSSGKYSLGRIAGDATTYLVDFGVIKQAPPETVPLNLESK